MDFIRYTAYQHAFTPRVAMSIIQAVPTNIITGFLGVGKTTAILHLLKNKPPAERWAVLVNEFGEIGLDGEFIATANAQPTGVFIREVAGGCMCCAAGVPMQVALNQLLRQSKPHRLLIEPTGLGHPREVMAVLTSTAYRTALQLRATITLLDARNLSNPRYSENATFKQQLAIADIIVANKKALYGPTEQSMLDNYLATNDFNTQPLFTVDYGEIETPWLDVARKQEIMPTAGTVPRVPAPLATVTSENNDVPVSPATYPERGFIKSESHGEGFTSIGWQFPPSVMFNHQRIIHWLENLSVERVKAIIHTDQGILGFNKSHHDVKQSALPSLRDNRIEIIAPIINPAWEAEMLSCLHDSQ